MHKKGFCAKKWYFQEHKEDTQEAQNFSSKGSPFQAQTMAFFAYKACHVYPNKS